MIEASALEGREEGMIAVMFTPATSAETFDRLARVYALTPRRANGRSSRQLSPASTQPEWPDASPSRTTRCRTT